MIREAANRMREIPEIEMIEGDPEDHVIERSNSGIR